MMISPDTLTRIDNHVPLSQRERVKSYHFLNVGTTLVVVRLSKRRAGIKPAPTFSFFSLMDEGARV
jgi:hypothetical protein